MARYCAVASCKNNSRVTRKTSPQKCVRYYQFPKDKVICNVWVEKCARKRGFNPSTAAICSDHFKLEDYRLQFRLLEYAPRKWKLKKDAIPSIKLPEDTVTTPTGILKYVSKIKAAALKLKPGTPPLPTSTILLPEPPKCSQPSTSSSCGTPSADPFGGEEPSCSREEVPGVATTLQLLPEQTEEPFLGVVNKPRSYKKGSDKTYCRFCLQSSGKNTSTPLAVVDLNYPGKSDVFRKKKMEKVEEINKMLRFCLPFYDSLTFNPVICSICLGRLKVAYEFSKQCFKNQQLIEKYADTYSATERVINLNEMIETKFKLPDDGNMSESETFSDIPQVTRTSNRISQKRKYPNYNDPPLKKRKACSETYEDDSTNSSDNTSNIKIEPDDDDNSGLIESLKMELDDEDNSFGFTERTLDDVPQSYNISEEGIKVEPNYIDCPDFIKSEQVDDLHEEHKVFDERTGIGTDSERQHLYSQGLGNVSVATKNDPLFVKEPSFSTVGTGLEDSTDD